MIYQVLEDLLQEGYKQSSFYRQLKIVSKKEAIAKLKVGDPIIFQTDTLPAIGCLPQYWEVIYKVKKRDRGKALILMGSELCQVIEYVAQPARNDVRKISKKYWPGPLTLVVPLSDSAKLKFSSSDNTLGIRVPNSYVAQSLIRDVGPLATSSANISGILTSTNAESVARDLPEIDLLGPLPWQECSGKASTIISWCAKGKWNLLRNGEVSITNFE